MPSLIPLPVNRPSPTRASFFEEEQFPIRWNSPSRKPFRPVPVQRTIPTPEPLITPKPQPKTTTEWKKALAEVKRDYVNRKYRQCYGRCHEILDNTNAKDLHKVEASYIIYLRFYAASAIEMQVRSLQHTSPYRTKLLLQAREHYRIASDLAAEEDAAMRRPSFRALSPMSSLHSPVGSDMSHSTVSTRMSSPAPSLSSLDSCMKPLDPVAPKPKKRVAFCDVPTYEPFIRPDSPTLGFDDWFIRQPTPEPVIAPEPRSIRSEKPLPALPMPAPSIITTTSSPTSPLPQEDESEDPFLHARSIHHYCTILNSLQRQITSHMSWLDRDIAAALDSRPPQILTEEMRALEVRSRIERLRARGWKRQRFDTQRYEALRESALADMD